MIEDKLLILGFKRRGPFGPLRRTQGRPDALRQIYDKYKVEMLKLAVVLVGDVNTAEDVVHDVFVKFAQSAERIKLTGSLKAYLVTSTVNRVRNLRRDNGRHGETCLEEADLPSSSQRGPQQWAILSEQLMLLSQALQKLPYEQREVICLRMEMDMTFRQIATLQSISTDTVKGRYRYAIEKLRSVLDDEVEG